MPQESNIKYIILYHSGPFKTFEEVEQYDKSYKCEGKPIGLKEAYILKQEGQKIQYPKSSIRYDFVIEPSKDDYLIRCGRSPDLPKIHCSIGRLNPISLGILFIGDFNETNPTRKMLEVGASLIKGLMLRHDIPSKHILPERYFNNKSDHPGLKFNVKKFVKEYLENGPEA